MVKLMANDGELMVNQMDNDGGYVANYWLIYETSTVNHGELLVNDVWCWWIGSTMANDGSNDDWWWFIGGIGWLTSVDKLVNDDDYYLIVNVG